MCSSIEKEELIIYSKKAEVGCPGAMIGTCVLSSGAKSVVGRVFRPRYYLSPGTNIICASCCRSHGPEQWDSPLVVRQCQHMAGSHAH